MKRFKGHIRVQAYMNNPPDGREVDAYLTHPESRFAVAKEHNGWSLRHRASGLGMWSILPTRRNAFSLAELLSIIANWEGQGWDLSPLDDVEFGVGFRNREDLRLRALCDDMRRNAALETGASA